MFRMLRFTSVLNRIRAANRRRLYWKRVRKIRRDDLSDRLPIKKPESIGKVLLMEAQGGWGDSIYFWGLIRSLSECGVSVSIAVETQSLPYYANKSLCRVFDLGSEEDLQIARSCGFDAVVDLTYVNLKSWDIRKVWLKELDCFKFACGDIAAFSNLYDEAIDLSVAPHQSDRLGIIFNAVTGSKASVPIRPYFPIEKSSAAEQFLRKISAPFCVYVNTVGGEENRCFSDRQIELIAKEISNRANLAGIFYSKSQLPESAKIFHLHDFQISDATAVISQCRAIITPDTSITHLGSAFDIPTLTYFCGNDRDYFPKYKMSDAWKPISRNSRYLEIDDHSIETDGFHGVGHRVRPIFEIPDGDFYRILTSFLDDIQSI